MKLNSILPGILCFALALNPTLSLAQEKEAGTEKKEITIGSHVLKQKGESEYSYKNEDYYYEKIWEVPGASKEELYKRAKNWLNNLTEAHVSDVNFDESEQNQLAATLEINILEKYRQYRSHEAVRFRWTFSFKEGKIRLQGSNFRYYGDYDHGMATRQVATGYGMRTESYHDANEYDMSFHNLRPLTKGQMKNIYEDFDALYLKIVRAMKKQVLTNADSNW